jgi:hypothetical protein
MMTGLESLEGRELMAAGGIYGIDGTYINRFDYRKLLAKRENPPAPPTLRRVEMALPAAEYGANAKVVITLYGPGSLLTPETDANGYPVFENGQPKYVESQSTHIDANGLVNIIFDGTTSESQIIGAVSGTRKNPRIAQIRDADVSDFDTTGVGTNQMGYVNLSRFDLARGGRINLSAGVQRIFLNDIYHATQIDLAALATPPTTSPQNPGGLNSTTTTSSSGSTAVSGGGSQRTTTTTVNGITIITTLPTVDQITVSNGELTGVGGIILPGAIPNTSGNTRVEVQGVELIVRNVRGQANPDGQPEPRLGSEYVAGVIDNDQSVDKDNVVFYKVNRDETTLAIVSATADSPADYIDIEPPASLGVLANPELTLLGSGLGEFVTDFEMTPGNFVKVSEQVVAAGYSLVDNSGTTRYFVNAYSVVSRLPLGSFEVKNPDTGAPFEFDGLGGSSGNLYVTKSAGGTNSTGLTQGIDLSASLNSGTSVFLGSALNYPSTFNSKGGTAGATGVSFIYNVGLSYFSAWNPENPDPQLGIMKIAVGANKNLSVSTTARIGGAFDWNSPVQYVMGSVDQNLVVIDPTAKATETTQTTDGTTVTRYYYTAQTYDPNSLASTGSFKLYVGANETLGGLSESFYPQLLGASVIDVRGNLKTFSASKTENMVLNVNGIASYVRINQASDTEILGRPILHLSVGWRPNANVKILSSSRPTTDTPGGKPRPGTRGGVQIVKNLPVLGPFVNPIQRATD